MNIGIKFCGHCRPYLDMTHVAKLLKKAAPDMNFTAWNKNSDVLLVMHACPGDCTTIPPFDGPKFEVSANTFNYTKYDKLPDLAEAIISALRDVQGTMAPPDPPA